MVLYWQKGGFMTENEERFVESQEPAIGDMTWVDALKIMLLLTFFVAIALLLRHSFEQV